MVLELWEFLHEKRVYRRGILRNMAQRRGVWFVQGPHQTGEGNQLEEQESLVPDCVEDSSYGGPVQCVLEPES